MKGASPDSERGEPFGADALDNDEGRAEDKAGEVAMAAILVVKLACPKTGLTIIV